LDKFKIFKAEVENQHNIKINLVRSGRGGEYYGRHTLYDQVPGPFARFLQENGIVAQYLMPGDTQQNGVAERRNRTLIDMMRSMVSYSTLPISLWMEALKPPFIFLIEYRVSRCLKHHMKCGQSENPH
jgi:transposase InsO family protein